MKETFFNIIHLAKRYRLATFSNLLGLIVAFASFYLIMTQIIYQVTYNHGIEDYERLYRMETDFVFNEWQYTDNICRPLAAALDSLPEVESYSVALNTSLRFYERMYLMNFKKAGGKVAQYVYTVGNNTAVSTLTSKVLDGSIEWTDEDQEGIIIPASIARDYFGTVKAAGKEMLYLYTDENGKQETYPLKVRGVYEDFPEQSEPTNRIFGNDKYQDMYSMNFVYNCIVKFKTLPADMDAFTDTIKQRTIDTLSQFYVQNGYGDQVEPLKKSIQYTSLKFTSLKDSYFEYNSFTTGDKGYKEMLMIMKLTCLLVLIIAAINFLNFILAESPMRISGLNTRRVMGASRGALRLGIIRECVITSVGACLLALVACHLIRFLPVTSRLTEGSLALSAHWPLVLLLLSIAAVLGIVVGIYPALFATSFSPTFVLKGRFGLTPIGKIVRSILVCLQLTISLLMVSYICVLYLQGRYIYDSPYGYDKDHVIFTSLPYQMENSIALYQELMTVPGIESVSFSSTALGTTDGHLVLRSERGDQLVRYAYMTAGYNYPTTMGIDIIEGRSFSQQDDSVVEVIINEAARRKWGWVKVGDRISTGIDNQQGDSAIVVGVFKDLRYGTTRIANDDPFIIVNGDSGNNNILNVRIAADADKQALRDKITQLARKHSGERDIEAEFFDDMLESTYQHEFRYINQMIIISIICMLITIIGIICMTYFETEYRRKEIGIRKVAGATSREIVMMFCRHNAAMLAISFLIATPLAYWIGKKTLKHFAEQAVIQWWIFPLSLLIVGIATLGSILLQCWRIARENPALSIKDE